MDELADKAGTIGYEILTSSGRPLCAALCESMSAQMILIVRALGRFCIDAISALGRLVLFALATLSHVFRPPFYLREFFTALLNVGYLSLPVVGLTALFTGAALALQIYSGGSRFNAPEVVPQIVAIGMVRELGPVLVGLMIAAARDQFHRS